MHTLPPGRHAFDGPLALLMWAADEGVLDDTWLDAVEALSDGGYLLRFRHRLRWMKPPPATAPGDHTWWRERTYDDVLPLHVHCIDVADTPEATGLGYIHGYMVYEQGPTPGQPWPGGEPPARMSASGRGVPGRRWGVGLHLLAGDGEVRLRAARFEVEVLPVAHRAPRCD